MLPGSFPGDIAFLYDSLGTRGARPSQVPAPIGATHLAVDFHRAILGPSPDRESVHYAYRFKCQEGQVSLEAP
jgi:hypothetical protein